MEKRRCGWVSGDPLYVDYHDHEWGVPVRDDQVLFEFLLLEGAQAGLSWITILRKRENYRRAFARFDAQKIARFDDKKLATLMLDEGIVRNRLKVGASVKNAKAFLAVQKEHGSFADYLLTFTGGHPIENHWKVQREVPARTEISDAMSKDLKRRGFTFVGSTIMYAFMQAVGLVNDHLVDCFRWREVKALAAKVSR